MESLSKDTFIEICLKLPAPSIFNLCSTAPDFRSNCKRWENDLYRRLIARDGVKLYGSKDYEKYLPKQTYITGFLQTGQPYYVNIIPSSSSYCSLGLSNKAVIKDQSVEKDLKGKYVKFYLGGKTSNPYDREMTVSDFTPGKKYTIYGYFTKNGISQLFVARSHDQALKQFRGISKMYEERLYIFGCIERSGDIYVIQDVVLT